MQPVTAKKPLWGGGARWIAELPCTRGGIAKLPCTTRSATTAQLACSEPSARKRRWCEDSPWAYSPLINAPPLRHTHSASHKQSLPAVARPPRSGAGARTRLGGGCGSGCCRACLRHRAANTCTANGSVGNFPTPANTHETAAAHARKHLRQQATHTPGSHYGTTGRQPPPGPQPAGAPCLTCGRLRRQRQRLLTLPPPQRCLGRCSRCLCGLCLGPAVGMGGQLYRH